MPHYNSNTTYTTYNGNFYRVLYCGHTKYGHKAHLAYVSGSKNFWVMSDRIGPIFTSNTPPVKATPNQQPQHNSNTNKGNHSNHVPQQPVHCPAPKQPSVKLAPSNPASVPFDEFQHETSSAPATPIAPVVQDDNDDLNGF